MVGLVPAIPIVRAPSSSNRDRRDRPGDDELVAARFAPLTHQSTRRGGAKTAPRRPNSIALLNAVRSWKNPAPREVTMHSLHHRYHRSLRSLLLAGAVVLAAVPAVAAEVTPERLANAEREPGNWLMNHRTYDAQRY